MAVSRFRTHKNVPDGIYDDKYRFCRYNIVNENYTIVISKTWLEQGGPAYLEPHLKLAWGSYPDVPPKPKKENK